MHGVAARPWRNRRAEKQKTKDMTNTKSSAPEITAYQPVAGSRLTNDQAQRWGTRMADLWERDRDLTVQAMIADAKDPGSPLHDGFTWNIRKAAEERWKDQAGHIRNSIAVVVTGDSELSETSAVRAFVHVLVDRQDAEADEGEAGGGVFMPITVALGDERYWAAVLAEIMQDLKVVRAKAERFKRLATVTRAIDRAIQEAKKQSAA